MNLDTSEGPESYRHCPSCGAPDLIARKEALWPKTWCCPNCSARLQIKHDMVLLAPELDDMDEGFDLKSFDLLVPVEGRHFWFRSRNEMIVWLVQKFARDSRHVLEIGCGTGFVLHALKEALPSAQIAGSELHSKGLVAAKRRHGTTVELIQMDARACGLTGALDLVGAFDVLEHIPEDDAVLTGIIRMLRPGGRLIATVPQHPWMWSAADDLAHHQRRYRVGELAAKAESAGLRVIYKSSFMTLAFPFMVLARMIERQKKVASTLEEHNASEFGISKITNGILMTLCSIEHVLRRLRVPLPFGGSQVLVAERPK